MRTILVVNLLAGLLLLAPPLDAADPEGPDVPERYEVLVGEFFDRIEANEYRGAIDEIFKTNPWMRNAADEINQLKAQFASLPDIAGELHGHELIGEQHFADSFVYLYYIVEYDRTPFSFYFTFYRPAGTWRLYSFEYREDLSDLAFELLKMKLTMPEPPEGAAGEPRRANGRPRS